jgi:hypothetical protein
MDETLAVALGWSVVAIAFFSFLGVRSWVDAQRREREAFYKSEAIKKIAEMQGAAPEPVLALLREALKPPPAAPSAFISNAQAKAYYRSETMKRVADLKGGDAEAVLAVMREDERRAGRRVREGLKLAGLILAGVGVGLLVFLQAIIPDSPVYLVASIPLLVGGALLGYAFVFAPTD